MTHDEYERFRPKFWPDFVSGCWVWINGLYDRRDFYGAFYIGGKMRRAHAVSYEHHKGPIADGLEIDHLCRNTLCVNPDHLEAVPHVVNVGRGNAGVYLSERTHCPAEHPYAGDNLMISNGRRYCRICHRAATKRSRGRRT
jgi:hypothetical protein